MTITNINKSTNRK